MIVVPSLIFKLLRLLEIGQKMYRHIYRSIHNDVTKNGHEIRINLIISGKKHGFFNYTKIFIYQKPNSKCLQLNYVLD